MRWGDDQPVLWIIPGLGLTFFALINFTNLFLHFIPASINNVFMAMASAFVSSMSAGFIMELMKGRGRLTYYTIAGTWVIGLLIYNVGHGFLESNLINGTQTASISLLGTIITGVSLTVIPGVFTGSVVGGLASLIPDELLTEKEVSEAAPQFAPNSWPGYEKICVKCGQVMPYDSVFCSHCGSVLKRRLSSDVRFCRYCGNRLHFKGEFCPDCGREINVLSKPKVYVSQ